MNANSDIARTYRLLSLQLELEGNSKNRILAMEGLRGLAILLVFTYHYYGLVWAHVPAFAPIIAALGTVGGSGVDLFFVLSGYLIYGAVSKPSFHFRTFVQRRAERIYPSFLVVLSFYVLMSIFSAGHGTGAKETWDRIPANGLQAALYIAENICFLPGILPIQPVLNVAWSLSYEWFFYLSLPLVFVLGGLRSLSRRTRSIGVLTIVLATVAMHLTMPMWFYRSGSPSRTCHIRAIMFLGGILVYELNKLRTVEREAQWLRRLAIAIGAATLAALILSPKPVEGNPAWAIRRETILSSLMFLSYAPLVYFALRGEPSVAKPLSWTPLRWLGNMSYSFYLLHGVPLHGLGTICKSLTHASSTSMNLLLSIAGWPIALGISAIASGALFVLVERPFSLTGGKSHKAAAPSERPVLTAPALLNQFEN